jgi:hypothetical protein
VNPTQVDMTHTNNRRNGREPRRASLGADTRSDSGPKAPGHEGLFGEEVIET